ncbi:MAG: hypothetical protein EA352_02855 [Gemmatimonadales bacterium]|nr:MAG: hypothetical protein EA352_02855 [Gemmatimonadales bacterium]
MHQEPIFHALGPRPGPTLVVLAGMHGNEPAGVRAMEGLARRIEARGGIPAGELLGVVGNPGALRAGQRQLDADLNRIWTVPPASVRHMREGRERRRITRILAAARRRSRGELHVVDLHTTSGEGPPFLVVGTSAWGKARGRALPLPLVEGLARRLPGTLTQWLDEQGVHNLVLEAGPHLGEDGPGHALAFLQLVAADLGILPARSHESEEARERLARATRGLPRRLVLSLRHPLRAGDEFRMEPGFRNLDPVRRGQLLAGDRSGPIHAPMDGWLLLPLYQLQGSDGFFMAVPAEDGQATGHVAGSRRGGDVVVAPSPGVRPAGTSPSGPPAAASPPPAPPAPAPPLPRRRAVSNETPDA